MLRAIAVARRVRLPRVAVSAAPARRLTVLATAAASASSRRAVVAAAAAAPVRRPVSKPCASSASASASASASLAASAGVRFLLTEASAFAAKKTTGIYGREVIPNAREVLIDANEKLIAKAKELGANPFNDYVVRSATYHLTVLNKHTDNNLIEAELELGQMEDMVEAAENMMDLLVYLNTEAKEKPWLPDPEGDKEYKECFHPVFGDEEFQDEWKPALPGQTPSTSPLAPKP